MRVWAQKLKPSKKTTRQNAQSGQILYPVTKETCFALQSLKTLSRVVGPLFFFSNSSLGICRKTNVFSSLLRLIVHYRSFGTGLWWLCLLRKGRERRQKTVKKVTRRWHLETMTRGKTGKDFAVSRDLKTTLRKIDNRILHKNILNFKEV